MADQAKRQQRRNEEDAVFNRMLLWLVGAVLAEALVLVVKRLYVDFKATELGISIAAGLMNFFHVFTFVGLALTVLGVIWCLSVRKKQKGLRLAVGCTVALGFLWVVALLCWRLYDTGVKLLVALPIAAAVLILIWFLYQKAFFCSAVITACGLALRGVFRPHGGSRSVGFTVVFVVGWLLLIAAAVAVWKVWKNGGHLGRLSIQGTFAYVSLWITCAVVAAALLLAFLLGAAVTYYLLYVLIGWLFCLAVFFTVKML